MKRTLLFFFFCIPSLFSIAQNANKINFELELPFKFSLGNQIRKDVEIIPGFNINYPINDTYNNVVFGLNANALYSINTHMLVGMGGGVNGSFQEEHPINANAYYNRLMIPLYAKFRYLHHTTKSLILLFDINAGYQVFENGYLLDDNGFRFYDSGGLMAGAELGFGKDFGENSILLKAGYELNQYNHSIQLDTFSSDFEPSDFFKYKSYFNTIKLGLAITFN